MIASRRLAFVVMTALVGVAHPAEAAPSENVSKADALFEEGRALLDKGDFARACTDFEESRRLDPQIGVTLFLAECYERAGRLASAWSTFREAAEEAVRANDARASVAKTRASQLEPRLAKIVMSISAPPANGLVVKRDGREVPRSEVDVPFPVDPGTHVVEASAPGKAPWRTEVVVAGEGTIRNVPIPLLAEAGGAGEAAAAGPSESSQPALRIVGIGAMGLSVVAFAVGGVFGVKTLGRKSDLQDRCPTYPNCDARDRDALTKLDDEASSAATVSTAAFIVGGVLLVGGAILFFTHPRRTTTAIVAHRSGIALTW